MDKKKKVFMSAAEKRNISSNIKFVDEVITFLDNDSGSCINVLEEECKIIEIQYGDSVTEEYREA